MTRISEIHGIGQDEFAQRGAEVTDGGYLPYLSLTSGEMRLMLARQRAKIYAQFYPDVPQYRQAMTMIDNALNAGVSNGVNFVGAIYDDYLQQMARIIKSASRQTAPASGALFYRPGGVVRSIGAIIPYADRYKACLDAANKLPGGVKRLVAYAKCTAQFKVEKIYNEAIEKTGHHVLYHKIPESKPMPNRVYTKLILQLGGVQGMATVGDIQKPLMAEWVENGIISKNAQIGVGPWGSVRTGTALAPDPEKYFQRFSGGASDKWMPGVNRIGLDAATITLIVGAIVAALGAAKNLIEALRKEQATIKAEGFGTESFSGKTSDWDSEDVAPGLDQTTLLLLASGALLLLSSDSN